MQIFLKTDQAKLYIKHKHKPTKENTHNSFARNKWNNDIRNCDASATRVRLGRFQDQLHVLLLLLGCDVCQSSCGIWMAAYQDSPHLSQTKHFHFEEINTEKWEYFRI
jgi:hypothetical protein